MPLRPKGKSSAERLAKKQASERVQSDEIAREKEITRAKAAEGRNWLTNQPQARKDFLLAEFESSLIKSHIKDGFSEIWIRGPFG